MQELEIDCKGKLYIDIMDLPDSCVIILSNGKAKVTELPAFAETKIITHQGLVKRIRWDEGEEF